MSEIGNVNSDSVAHSSGAGFGRLDLNTDRHRYSIDRPFKGNTSSVKGKDRLDSDKNSPVIGNDWSETDVNSDSNTHCSNSGNNISGKVYGKVRFS